ncbi:hypothetical protein CHS0354_020005 [Potamilus streckersoni]|uniref:FMRFamide n=1 Tax=Potamilus streckersoni TaxID=2493646 RepID=A0AAE0SZA5_9BIVA|nr:hypothetical protein CHS0354_020005 [Potamilus streckersoni]
MKAWSYVGLLAAIFAKWLTGRVLATDELTALCMENEALCDSLFNTADEPYREKRFLRFGRALSGDGFLRFGRTPDGFLRIGKSDGIYPLEDKRFLRFGRSGKSLDDMLTFINNRIQSFELANGIKLRKKRSEETNAAQHPSENTGITAVQGSDKPEKQKREVDMPQTENGEKRFMRFGRDPADEAIEKADKRFMRFGREPDAEKRFMRFGRGEEDMEKRFMRFGRDGEDKRFMRFGRDPDSEKRFMRFGRGDDDEEAELKMSDAEKRFMRFGRDGIEDKRFMRFGRGDERFIRFGTNSYDDSSADKRFMRFGKRFMRFGRDMEADKRFMRFGRNGLDEGTADKSFRGDSE